MSKQQKFTRSLTGHFLGWGDDRTPHRYLKLATASGEHQRVKIAKSLRTQIQDWQPGLWVTLMGQERIDLATGERKIKIEQLLSCAAHPSSDSSPILAASVAAPVQSVPSKIQICGGSSCRRRGSENICQSMQAYLDRENLTDRVQIETVKCLHQCKAAPHAIVTSATAPGKTHYRQLQPSQVQVLLAKHFPIPASLVENGGTSLMDKIKDYLQQQQLASTLISHPQHNI